MGSVKYVVSRKGIYDSKVPLKLGNSKIGTNTLIINICGSTHCPSRALGMCELGNHCYAMKSERMFKTVRDYRIRCEVYWDAHTAEEIAADIVAFIKAQATAKRPNLVTHIRFNESGDFRTQADVDKLNRIAQCVPVGVYGFTHRRDLDYTTLCSNITINGSSWMIDNEYRVHPTKASYAAATNGGLGDGDVVMCANDCTKCDACKSKRGVVIHQQIH